MRLEAFSAQAKKQIEIRMRLRKYCLTKASPPQTDKHTGIQKAIWISDHKLSKTLCSTFLQAGFAYLRTKRICLHVNSDSTTGATISVVNPAWQ